MKKRIVVLMLSTALGVSALTACGGAAAGGGAQSQEAVKADEAGGEAAAADEDAGEVSDQEAADRVASLIDAIYVQKRTEETDAQCAEAKRAWDELTDAQKELVEGVHASPDYFGLDTGDASLDDPGNADGIGDNELLVVSFGTSYNASRVDDIYSIEKALADAYPDWAVRRAFTAQIIINHIQARDGEFIDNMDQALERAVANGVKNLVVQPTHLMRGAEYDELVATLDEYRDSFETVSVAEPLLGSLKEDAKQVNPDQEAVAVAVTEAAVADSGYGSLAEADEAGTAFVMLGHGTSHTAMVYYSQMVTQLEKLGYGNVFVGTVDEEPEETSFEAVLESVSAAGYKNIILRPLMVVAGDHANNDMSGDEEDSWKSMFIASGKFEKVDTQIAGLGGIEAIQQIYIDHTKSAMENMAVECGVDVVSKATSSAALEDGTYSADFKSDSSMFRVSEACDGKGVLTVKDGAMSIHLSLTSKKILNLFRGTAEDAAKPGAAVLEPTTDTVTYKDGTTEEVYGFDVPVPALGEEFDLALVGTKGTWYDHKVTVSNPVIL